MRRLLTLVTVLSFPAAALANPVAPTSLPPDAPLLGAVLVEVAIVTTLLWKCHLRILVLVPCWYIINLISFYVLLPGVANLYSVFHLYDMPILLSLVAIELFVVIVEAVVIYAFSRSPVVLQSESKLVTWRLAFLASLLGNIGSALAHPLLSHVI